MSMKEIKLADIVADPNQPRKYFDETAFDELVDSIREKGIIQPILVRPSIEGPGYMVVCGERRYRAAVFIQTAFKKRDTIPAVIRELSDDEALELQIIENLQRKDVHPMEEAVAFKSLLDHGKDIKEIAARIGKSEFYARQRMKLNALSKDWQAVFYAGRVSTSTALTIALFDDKIQEKFYKDEADGNSRKVEINSYVLSRYRGELNKAAFDITDPALNKKMGACTNCQFNSGVASLFPDAAVSPKCSNITCFKDKTDLYFSREFDKALQDPEVMLVHDEHGKAADKFVAKAEKDGHRVLARTAYNEVNKPVAPDWEDWFEDNEDDYDNAAEARKTFDKDEVADYHKQLADYENKVAGGKYKKAFMLTGGDRGTYIYIDFKKITASNSGSSKSTKEKEATGKLTAADIDGEIQRLQDREKRAKELDAEKVHEKIIEALKTDKSLKALPAAVHPNDRILLRFLVQEHISYDNKDTIKKVTGLEGIWGGKDPAKLYTTLGALTEAQMSFLVRQLMMKFTASSSPTNNTGYMHRMLATSLGTIPIEAYEAGQKETAAIRQDRVAKRIAQLKEQKSELKKPKAKAAKTAKPKKGAKKAEQE